MHEQSCCFANRAYCFFAVLVVVTVVVAQAPYKVSVYLSENLFYSSAIPCTVMPVVYRKANFAQIIKIVKKDHFFLIYCYFIFSFFFSSFIAVGVMQSAIY